MSQPLPLAISSRQRNVVRRPISWVLASFAFSAALCISASAQGPTPGQNVNMVSGTKWPGGDPFLQRQNEPSIAVSTRNPQHLLAGANDYRTVDLNLLATGETGDAWLGLFKSFNGGATWQSTLIPGYPLDQTPEGLASPLKAFTAASDPVVSAGTNGLFFYSGIAFNRSLDTGVVFVSRFIDLNNKENGDATTTTMSTNQDPIRYISTAVIDAGNAGQFFDKPWVAVDIPRPGAGSCTLTVSEPGTPGGTVTQSFPAGNVYLAYSRFVGNDNLIRSQIFLSRSLDCGTTWSKPTMVSQTFPLNQGVIIAIDPGTGFVYVAWRTFAAAGTLDSINVAKSIDFGNTFTKAVPVQTLAPFNSTTPTVPAFFGQGTSGTTFRTNAFPALAVDATGQLYLAWSQRGVGPNGDARIMLATSADGVNWSAPAPVDNGMITDDSMNMFSRGHQFMPAISIVGGKVMVVYYDLRLDHTLGFFTPNTPFQPDSSKGGRLYAEERKPQGELAAPNQGPAVFTPFIDDLGLTQRRHTVDLMVAQAVPSANPAFTPSVRVSQYIFGLRGDVPNPTQLQQLQEDPPNLPLFAMGSEPFFGDYIDIAALSMVPTPPGGWAFNTAANPNQAPVFYTTWTTNQDVRPPLDGNWTHYTPVGAGGTSVFDPTQTRPNCVPGQEGMRNQNIYSSQITQGLQVSSPQTLKPLSTTLQRAFVVLVQNLTNFDKTFHMSIVNQPPGGFASFIAGTNIPGPPPSVTPPSMVSTGLDVDIPPHSGITRPVFATSTSPGASITVSVVETTPAPGNSGLASFVVFNPDPTSPLQLINPDGVTGEDIATVEIYSPSTSDPALYNPNAPNPNAPNPNGPNTGLSNPNAPNPNAPNPNAPNPNAPNPNAPNPNAPNPDLANPNAPNPNAPNSVIANPNAPNPNAPNPNVPNTNITSGAIFDAIYTVTNTGNTSASYRVKLVGNNPNNIPLQLAVNKTYQTPTSSTYQTPTGPPSCQLTTENHNNVQALINNPPIVSPANLNDPGIQDPSPGNTTFTLFPGETAELVLRGYFASFSDPAAAFNAFKSLITQVVPVVVSHAANTNTNMIVVSGPLLITTTTLPQGIVGQSYSAQLAAVGGNPGALTWAIASGTLPAGLMLDPSSGIIAGTPTTAGTSNFTVTATDSGTPRHTTSRSFSITVIPSLNITTPALPQGVTGFEYAATLQATGGTPPYSWSSSALPAGLALNSTTGQISGIPTAAGSTSVTIQVKDSGSPAQQVSATLNLTVTSPAASGGGDFIFRGFYLPNYTGTGLVQATLNFSAAVAGNYTVTLTAHSNAYNGTVIGSSTTTVTLPGTVGAFVPTIFNLPSPATRVVPGSLVAFTMTLVSGPSEPYFAVSSCRLNDPTCTTGGPFVETEDTTPPLSVFRRNGVVVTLVSVPSPSMSVAATGVSTAPRSGGEALAADLTASNLFVKSLVDPGGADLQFAQIAQNRTVTILGDFPSMVNSDGSGIAVHPFGGIIVADEAGAAGVNRIARIDLSTPPTSSTLFTIPWKMNPNANGKGQQQYAPILTSASPTSVLHLFLYFWDSTQSTLYSVDALAPTFFTALLPLEQNLPAGNHVTTLGNHIVFDPNTRTLLLTDGSTNTVIEVNPASSPVTTSTLFSGLPGTPTSIALSAGGTQVFVQIGNSIYVGPRSGGALSLFATGFSFLTNIVIGNATSGSGTSLFAVDKKLNTVYEMPLPLGVLLPAPLGLTLTQGGAPNNADTFVTPFVASQSGIITTWKAQFTAGSVTAGCAIPVGIQLKTLRLTAPNTLTVISAGTVFNPLALLRARFNTTGCPSFADASLSSVLQFTDSGLTVSAGDIIGVTVMSDPAVNLYFLPLATVSGNTRTRLHENTPVGGTIDLSNSSTGTLTSLAPALQVNF